MNPTCSTFSQKRAFTFLLLLLFAAGLSMKSSAHEDDDTKKLPPTKAGKMLAAARLAMDTAKKHLNENGRYACCIKASSGSKVAGCDLCAKENGSCRCAQSLAEGKGVCGECYGGWKAGRGAMPGIKKASVTLLSSSHQGMAGMPGTTGTTPEMPADLTAARKMINDAKRVLVKEKRFACCVGHGGCDECAYETACPCGRQAALAAKGKGICGQCYDGWQSGIGRLAGLTSQDMKMDMDGMTGMHGGMEKMGGMESYAGISMNQKASGTSWQPAASPMYMLMRDVGRWNLMGMYNVNLSYDRQEGPHGDYQYNSTNYAMLMATRVVGKDQLELSGMLSLEPLTVTPGGYPLLFQSGESYHGKPLVDRQHPHDLFMEVAAHYRHALSKDSGVQVYLAPSGEPALGPTAYMHRLSALDNPMAPIGHHWQDSTHITFGTATLGAWSKHFQLESSIFTGREPNEHRFDFDRMKFDSYSARLTYNPSANWSMQTSYGSLHSPEQLRPDEAIRRTTASATYTLSHKNGGFWSTSLIWGRNAGGGLISDSVNLESELNLANRNTFFTRLEYVQKSGDELNLLPGSRKFDTGALTFGYIRDITPNRSYHTGIGAAVTFYPHSGSLDSTYGSSPMGFWLFVRIRPSAMNHMH